MAVISISSESSGLMFVRLAIEIWGVLLGGNKRGVGKWRG
jgi:hypothetical protein